MAQYRRDSHAYLPNCNTIFEVVMLADQYGNRIGPANPSGVAVDAFGRARSSQPVTLFDSFNRYQINGGFAVSNTAGGSYSYSSNTSTVTLTVKTASSAKVVRETKKIFAYQPGKSLQILTTFVMNPAKIGLRQRIGYFNSENGIFVERANTAVRFVIRSNGSDTPVDTIAEQSDWNIDPLDGSGPSHITLDLDKAQIFFTDLEWLGVGTVRCGFVINGQLIHCHSFHHANIDTSTYMSTACLPVRYEIENTSSTISTSSLKQICCSVISEGGYELRGRPKSAGSNITSVFNMPTAGTYYPVISIRLKSTYLDAIVIPKDITLLGIGNNTKIGYRIVVGATIANSAAWISAGSDSAVEYQIGGTSTMSGGTVVKSGFIGVTNQSNQSVNLDSDLFKFQLERDGLAGTPTVFTLAATGAAAGDDALGTIDWEEVT